MKATEFAARCRSVAENVKTVYMKGVFGALVTRSLLTQKSKQYPEWYTAQKLQTLSAFTENEVFGFDCVCFIKGILWGWRADADASNGGAVYQSNGLIDVTVEGMRSMCFDVSADFSRIAVGELVFLPGHVGVYLGDGLCAECTTSYGGGVLLTACNESKTGYPSRKWDCHGKLRILTYEDGEVFLSLPRLEQGLISSAVESLQALLNAKADATLDIDGSFGPKTLEAVKQFQKTAKLTQDGVIGQEEWQALLRAE